MSQALRFIASQRFLAFIGLLIAALPATGAEWQWSVPVGSGRAFLWIPPDCRQVRAVIVGQHNMAEEGILEHPTLRKALGEMGIAEIWVAPPFADVFDFGQGAGTQLERILKTLASESGYSELEFAPLIPLGHSACASYPWNCGAWNPSRTLAMISFHGDAPLTLMTGSGKPNPGWGDHTIDGVPGLMVMAEYEWIEGRLAPAQDFRQLFPKAPIAVLAEPGRGHFDVSADAIDFLALYIRKAAEQRLPATSPLDQPPVLKPVDPQAGWLVERWHPDQPRKTPAAPFARYSGDRSDAFWCFDQEMAQATETYRSNQIGKRPQLLGFVQEDKIVSQTPTHAQVNLRFAPMADGITFKLSAAFLDTVDGGSPNTTRWTKLPPGSPLGHAAHGEIAISRITGPVAQIDANTFAVRLNRTASTLDRRAHDIWLLASHPGDDTFESAVQQAQLQLKPNTTGADQQITFPEIPAQKIGTTELKLTATASSGAPVYYYVREGPVEIDGNIMRFSAVPPRSKLPLKTTVVAWQWGRGTEPKLKAATPVERTFELQP